MVAKRPHWTHTLLLSAATLPLVAACIEPTVVGGSGTAGGGADSGSGATGGVGSGAGGGAPSCDTMTTAWMTTRGLTRAQYNNTVRDLLGDTSRPADAFPVDQKQEGFDVGPLVQDPPAGHYLAAAAQLADDAVANLPALLDCDVAASGEDACAQAFIAAFGRRAYRRPLDAAESASSYAIYQSAKAAATFEAAIGAVIESMLASPSFLYRLEADLPGANPSDVTAVLPYELATRLSYFLWNSMPDDELFAEAEAGGLSTPGGVEAQARRMLQDPRARDAVASFHAQWIGIDVPADQISKDASVFPAFDTSLMVAMQQETAAFAQHVVLDGDGLLPTLLTASFSFLNGPLAALYGVGGVEGEALVKTELDPSQRSGLFTHGSFLTVKSHAKVNSITHRGLTVRRRVLCQEMPPPPPDVDVTLPEDVEGTLRDKLLAITSAPECSACHVLMDPIGFGFENYDAIGQWRTQESGYPIDASGEVLEAEDASGPYVGSLELTEQLAQSAHVAQCVTTQWFQYALGQTGTASEACAAEAFEASGRNVRELLVAITLSSAFRYRPALSP